MVVVRVLWTMTMIVVKVVSFYIKHIPEVPFTIYKSENIVGLTMKMHVYTKLVHFYRPYT